MKQCEECDNGLVIKVDAGQADFAFRCFCPQGSRYSNYPPFHPIRHKGIYSEPNYFKKEELPKEVIPAQTEIPTDIQALFQQENFQLSNDWDAAKALYGLPKLRDWYRAWKDKRK